MVSVISLAGIVTLSLRESVLRRLVFVLVGLAVGSLLGDAFLHLIPEALESGIGSAGVGSAVMCGVLVFFVLEKFLHWHHCHGEHEECEEAAALHDHAPKELGALILSADFVHNGIDGIIIGASFLVSPEVGIATTSAVVLHEIPQEIADFGLLIHAGWSRARALLWNFLSALPAFLGALFVLMLGTRVEHVIPLAAAFTAGAFIYIASADLVPELHKTEGIGKTTLQILAVALGFGLMLILALFE